MAESDVELHDDGDGWVKVAAGDLNVDSPKRRGTATGQYRRALVHDPGDGLTLNWGNDYTGGVTLNGVRTITAHVPPHVPGSHIPSFQNVTIESGAYITLDSKGIILKATNLVLNQEEGVIVTGKVSFDKGSVTFTGPVEVSKVVPPPLPNMAPISIKYNVLDQLLYLSGEVQKLKEHVGIT
jgi:hypothetical protein